MKKPRDELDVLVVDDDEGVQEAIAGTLRGLGHRVRVADTLSGCW